MEVRVAAQGYNTACVVGCIHGNSPISVPTQLDASASGARKGHGRKSRGDAGDESPPRIWSAGDASVNRPPRICYVSKFETPVAYIQCSIVYFLSYL